MNSHLEILIKELEKQKKELDIINEKLKKIEVQVGFIIMDTSDKILEDDEDNEEALENFGKGLGCVLRNDEDLKKLFTNKKTTTIK